MLFETKQEFKDAVREYSIRGGFDIKFTKSEDKKVQANCQGCTWKIYVSTMSNSSTLQVKTYSDKHTCSRVFENHNATAEWLTKKYLDSFRINPSMKCKTLKENVKIDWAVGVSEMKCYRAKKQALEEIEGSQASWYERL